jgi:hypothetical protein
MRQLFQATGLQLSLLLSFGKARLEIKRVAMAVSHTKLHHRNDWFSNSIVAGIDLVLSTRTHFTKDAIPVSNHRMGMAALAVRQQQGRSDLDSHQKTFAHKNQCVTMH